MSRELCIMACVFCRDPLFQEWADQIAREQSLMPYGASKHARSEQFAKAFLLFHCRVPSRNDLDNDPDAAARFHDLVRKPFLEWKERQ